ncbi:HAMP domain-containing histidine kinase [Cryobacterium sp. TMT1-21]|uniref:histidine kinase n=1 Tax=Cryobacterium shii TaxID=1259235 RepID=A0AAQ2HEM6_9MICO|nr:MULTISPECIES: HAMP domain-containing sensor histidine kinase [Cryobacterium]TFC42821.1 HAMP domain-containing histidine kinase [Cryobacterium shii]TFC86698.1 HAMP domain-containing histidine kinase [Cryobacterium sp. TmT2-59]TFD11620.1 HAMP domain-containing histidine kinase [Cryobacterium sp. TMT4-10]TFD14756.1 HAMP domain-containing histidine kinase [Cryobacterium sp. TMT1-21]TFD23262.1 HAMP domain-containing histidine kinase [Cryobacterium sp. TMT2-23]
MHQSLMERWSRVSLRSKITGVTVLMLTLGLLVSGIGTMAMLRQYVIQQVDAQLQADAQTASNSYSAAALGQGTTAVVSSDYFVALYDEHGNLKNHTWRERPARELPQISIPLDLQTVIELDGKTMTLKDGAGDTQFLAVAVPLVISPQGTLGTLVMAVSLKPTENTMATYLTIFLGFGLGVVLVGALLTRLLVTSTFAPLREVERTAAAIADGDFSQRLGGATPNTEVGRLNRSLNTMLSRIDRLFKDRARTIDQMRRFVGDASHELRTPLVSVRGYAELYRMGALQSPEEIAQAMERIEKEAIRMGGLVEDLLELARLDETKPLALAPVDLIPLARDAALDAMASSPGRTVTVVSAAPAEFDDTTDRQAIDLAHSTGEVPSTPGPAPKTEETALPAGSVSFAGATLARLRTRKPRKTDVPTPPAEPAPETAPVSVQAVVMAEENKIRQVITNLMGNALRFSPADSPVELEVAVDRRNQRASIAVIDHGEGIPPQIRDKIFQRFWRADTSRARETGGSGLGLAIVASIVASHNGTVQVVDTPGGGATFRVWFPLAGSPNAPQRLAPTTP